MNSLKRFFIVCTTFARSLLHLAPPRSPGPKTGWHLSMRHSLVAGRSTVLCASRSIRAYCVHVFVWRMLQRQGQPLNVPAPQSEVRSPYGLCVQLEATLCLTICGKDCHTRTSLSCPLIEAKPYWASCSHVPQPTAGAPTHLNIAYTHQGKPPDNTTLSKTPSFRAKPQSTLTPLHDEIQH